MRNGACGGREENTFVPVYLGMLHLLGARVPGPIGSETRRAGHSARGEQGWAGLTPSDPTFHIRTAPRFRVFQAVSGLRRHGRPAFG